MRKSLKLVKIFLLEDFLDLEVVVSDKSQQADYSSNVLMKYKLDKESLLTYLLEHPLIEEVAVINGHLNIILRDELMHKTGEPSNRLSRMKTIHDRLNIEGFIEGYISKKWLPLVKNVNEMNYSLDNYKESFGIEKEIFTLFSYLDKGYIYRNLPPETLGGIYKVLKQMLLVLERI